jgi:nucleoside-diphosphate-sugar epimerase
MNTPQRVLVTGSAGRIGRAAVKELAARGHHVVGFDVRPTPGLPAEQSVVAGLSDVAALRRAAVGAACVVHLAATPDDARFPRGTPPDDGDNFLSELIPNNVVGPYQVMETARVLGIPRVVLASTGQVVDGHLKAGNIPVTGDVVPRPRYLYACTKVFLEALGQVYARQHGITVLAVRLGWCPRDPGQVAEIATKELFQDVYFSPGDAGRFFAAAVVAEQLPPYAVVFANSRFIHQLRYDLSETKRLLNWEPREQWPTGASEFA